MKKLAYFYFILLCIYSCDSTSYISCQAIYDLKNSESDYSEKYELLSAEYESLKGKKVFNSTLKDMNGSTKELYSYDSDVTVVNFWYTTCPPCVAETPYFIELRNEFRDSKASFVSVAKDSKEDLMNYLEKTGLNWDQYLADDIGYEFCVSSYPTTIVLDRDFKVMLYKVGAPTNKEGLEVHMEEIRESINLGLNM